MGNEVTKYEGNTESGQLIALALQQNASPETISKLMDLQERWEAGNARKAYVVAMTAFKQEAPAVLVKGDRVDFQTAKGRTSYNYANLGSIVQEITAILGKHDLSASWETAQDDKGNIAVTCHVTHSQGHRESVTLKGPADDSGNKNRIQAVGSTVTYLQRYTLLSALGLATGEDEDAQPERTPIAQPQSKSAGNQLHNPKTTTQKPKTEAFLYVEKGDILKQGKSAKGPWTLYGITINGEVYSTFSKTHYETAMKAHKESCPAKIEFEQTEKGRTLKSIEIVLAPMAIDLLCNTCQKMPTCEHPQPDAGSTCMDYVPVVLEEKTTTEPF